MKRLAYRLAYVVGLPAMARLWNRSRVMVLCYHGVATQEGRRPGDGGVHSHLPKPRFVEQLEYLSRHFNVVSMTDYIEARSAGRRLPPYSVVLTFDDGYRNFSTDVVPTLREYRFPSVAFLITDRVDRSEEERAASARRDDDGFLSWTDARELETDGDVRFASHTCSHPWLTDLSPDDVDRELRASLEALRRHLKSPLPLLAYPKGGYSDEVIARARRAGYVAAVTTDHGPNHDGVDVFAIRRTLVGDEPDLATFAARVTGLTALAKRLLGTADARIR